MREIEETESARLDWGFEGKGTGLPCIVVQVGYCSRTPGKVNEESPSWLDGGAVFPTCAKAVFRLERFHVRKEGSEVAGVMF